MSPAFKLQCRTAYWRGVPAERIVTMMRSTNRTVDLATVERALFARVGKPAKRNAA